MVRRVRLRRQLCSGTLAVTEKSSKSLEYPAYVFNIVQISNGDVTGSAPLLGVFVHDFWYDPWQQCGHRAVTSIVLGCYFYETSANS